MSQHRTFQDVKIFGERNTSTNAIKLLVERNSASRVLPSTAIELDPYFRAKVQMISWLPSGVRVKAYRAYVDSVFEKQRDPRYIWKHAMLNNIDQAAFSDCLVILTFRHPASWLLALQRKPHHHLQDVPADFMEFLKQPWKPTRRDNVAGPLSVFDLYGNKVHAALDFAARRDRAGNAYAIVRFEDFAVDQEAVFDGLRPWLREPAAGKRLPSSTAAFLGASCRS